jgi:hypothetical protein
LRKIPEDGRILLFQSWKFAKEKGQRKRNEGNGDERRKVPKKKGVKIRKETIESFPERWNELVEESASQCACSKRLTLERRVIQNQVPALQLIREDGLA